MEFESQVIFSLRCEECMHLMKLFFYFFIMFAPFISSTASEDTSQIEEQCMKENKDIKNSIVIVCADKASDAAKKGINVSYMQIVPLIKSRCENDPDKASSEIIRFELAKNMAHLSGKLVRQSGFLIGSPMYSIYRMNENIARADELSDYYAKLKQRFFSMSVDLIVELRARATC